MITTTASLNGGDAALLEAELDAIERAFPGANVVTYDQQAAVASRYRPALGLRAGLVWPAERPPAGRVASAGVWAIHLGRVLLAAVALRGHAIRLARALAPSATAFEALVRYRDADVVATNAGTMLMPHYRYGPRLVDYAVAAIVRTPVVYFTQTMGPFRPGVSSVVLSRMLRRSPLVLVRGDETVAHLRRIGVKGPRVVVAPDPVFVFAADADLAHGRARRLPEHRPKVGVSVRDWPYFDGQADYEAAVVDLCTRLVRERDAEITFLSTCQGIPEYWTDDSAVARRIYGRLDGDVQERILIDDGFNDTATLRAKVRDLDLVVATRLHMAILSLVSGTPAIPLAYEAKTAEVFGRLGASAMVIGIDQVGQGRLGAHVTRYWDRIDEGREALFAAVEAERNEARAVSDRLRAALGPDH